jgi:hypothetical protein
MRGAPECSKQRAPAATPHVGQGTEDNCFCVRSAILIRLECGKTSRNTVPFGTLYLLTRGNSRELKDGSRIVEDYGDISHLRVEALVHVDILSALPFFPLPGPKSPIEETNRSDPYSCRTVSCDDIAWVMHSQINARKSNHSN